MNFGDIYFRRAAAADLAIIERSGIEAGQEVRDSD